MINRQVAFRFSLSSLVVASLGLASLSVVGCAQDKSVNKGQSADRAAGAGENPAPPDLTPSPGDPQTPPAAPLPILPASNHPLGGWWVGSGQAYDSTGWVSECKSIRLGLVIKRSLAEAGSEALVRIEHFDYECDFGVIRWQPVTLAISETGSLRVNNENVGVLSDDSIQFELEAPNGNQYSFELSQRGDAVRFMDLRRYHNSDRSIITDGDLRRP